MNKKKLNNKILNATKWSSITEILAKIISPITNMILARILLPEAFGVVATVTMIVSFADMFTDAGFQKYLIQHEFKNDQEKFNNANVAFWTNLSISILLYLLIVIFNKQICILVGNKGYEKVIVVASLQLLMTSFSSIQRALYRREFDFKTLFIVRSITVFIPFVITIPLALLGLSYWSLIIGMLLIQLINAIILTIKSKWKPRLFYKISILKEMFSFSMWTLVEAISIWLTSWIDIFIISSSLNQYYLGIYKTSIMMVNTLMGLIISSIMPVFFSSLSRLQDDNKKFKALFYKFQKFCSILIFPLGVGIFIFRELAATIILGKSWGEASLVIGIWSLTSSLTIVLSFFNSEVYRAKGRPKISFLSQVLHLIFLVPICIVFSKYSFKILVYVRSWARIQGILVDIFFISFVFKFSLIRIFKNILPTLCSAILMGIFGYFIKNINNSYLWQFVSIIICSIFYFGVLYLFPSMKEDLNNIIYKIKSFIINKLNKIK
ncbi:lipopolysaccharide biosynthesis protein [Fusobacterium sp. MFO224]|uniref:lipopolysaccharide biosynthesis protein n=1 Tax=Fusobacterium sp. MFO224 TaxID=3378070 RepID=UPI003855323B